MRILVTGGTGFIGSHIVDHYITAGHDVAVVENLHGEGGSKKAHVNHKAWYYQADITDEGSLEHIFNEVQPEIVNHHASQARVTISTRHPQLDVRVNVLGLLNVLTLCTHVGARKIIFASSAASYGTPDLLPINEETPQRPQSPLGINKMAAEHYLRYWHQAHALTYTILRYSNVYGPRQDPDRGAGVIATFAQHFLDCKPVRIDGNGEQLKDYVYVEDVARANVLALDRGDNNIFCIGTGKGTSVNELYHILSAIVGYQVVSIHDHNLPGDIHLSYFDCTWAEHLLGWKPAVSLEEGIRATIEFLSKRYTL